MRRTVWGVVAGALLALSAAGCGPAVSKTGTDDAVVQAQAARRLVDANRGLLAPVYAPLAEQIVEDFRLADAQGVGIDLGSGPGTLVVELAKRTRMHWINADINPSFFPSFFRLAEAAGLGGHVSAVLADACNLPFRDGFADVVVSRGSYHFWGDRKKGFAEVYRVLKPGGVAFIGRGFSRNLPPQVARQVRARQGDSMKYDRQKAAGELRQIMTDLGIRDYKVHLPSPPGGEDINYGVWVMFRKPATKEAPRD